ncbi:uncharacterized protein N7500_002553 [Penicillium coprophilum]|uniref:uncharacterized protein n=1 Tax=Penicillium coprophilum TaxID=36646 RepID=UPI0023897414|nr:uncharacterized protein N7500_002553 [Penicillium coprophilum]KAJ5169770.1 hypothetical protein N7500_002553 [Penicillium coprophilum]
MAPLAPVRTGSAVMRIGWLLLSRLNNVKSRVWRAKIPPTSGETIEPLLAIDNPRRALVMLREPLTILAYLNHPVINTHRMNTVNLVREEWGRADDAWEATGQPMEYVQDWWDEWFRDRLKYMAAEVRKWVEEWAKKMSQHWAV